MKEFFAKLFGIKQDSVEPRTIDSIVNSFETQIIELDTRIAFDMDVAENNKKVADELLKEAARKEKDVERSNRIKSKIEDIIK
jgi:hypothetical protein